ncbi:uncharacterized protein Dwil_GK19183 [Drosophila willistoni]|uniref:Mitochondrial import receptor subunit TOM20 homolog n=1 Tax=Drosophila willistoni TaxID=7260 RepID=B4NAZ3_DROWI|nr:uncharacterized protein Dwil_GK19183 [Drosophila willistoni]
MLGKLKTACGILVGLTGVLFLGYCVYFDYKQHLDPDFKKKLHERRRRYRLAKKDKSGSPDMPDMCDHNEIERFFMKQVQLGESRIVGGDLEGAVDHFFNAVIVCNQPARLLHVLQGVLPPEVFNELVTKVQAHNNISQKPPSLLHLQTEQDMSTVAAEFNKKPLKAFRPRVD